MTTKPVSTPTFRMNDGDWICDDQSCQNVNFARRMNCNLCGREKPNDLKHSSKDSESKRKLGHEIGKTAAEKSKGLFSADDWQCGRCGNVNWARRTTCNMCNAPKFGDNEQRTGLGGGYNEREHVEYVEREESDSEFDDFGRRKKKIKKHHNQDDDDSSDDAKHQTISSSNSSKTNDHKLNLKYNKHKDIKNKESTDEDQEEEEEEEDEEEEEEGDVSKYKLDSDDDEEDDDEEDLSKYDLSDWGTDKA